MQIKEFIKENITGYFIAKIVTAISLFFIMFYFPVILEKKWIFQIVKGIWAFLLPTIAVSVLRFLIISFYNARIATKTFRSNFILGINSLTVVINVILFIIGCMIGMGIHPLGFLTSMTIVAMAIAVTFREYITNMISGLLIMFSNPLSVGDRVNIAGNKGVVHDITLTSIVLNNEDDDLVLVPNNLIFTQPFINLSAQRSRYFSIKFELPLHGQLDPDTIEKSLIKSFKGHPDLDSEHTITLQVTEIGKDFVRYKMEFIAISSSDRLHKKLTAQVLAQVLKLKKEMQGENA